MDRSASIGDFKAALLRRGSSLRLMTKYDPLLVAIQNGSLDNVRQVFAEGYTFLTAAEGGSSLHQAFDKGHMNIVHYLVKVQKVNVDAADGNGRTLLHKACHQLSMALVSELFNMGANVDIAQEEDGYTPMHIAAEKGAYDIVHGLIDRGADPAAQALVPDENDEYPTPTELARRNGHSEVAQLLDNETDPELLELKARKNRVMSKLAPDAKKVVNNELIGPTLVVEREFKCPEVLAVPSSTILTNLQYLPITETQLLEEWARLDVSDEGSISLDDFIKVYEKWDNFGAPVLPFTSLQRQCGVVLADDRVTFEQFCIMRLKVAQR